jgi:protein-tyrosine phosphatase
MDLERRVILSGIYEGKRARSQTADENSSPNFMISEERPKSLNCKAPKENRPSVRKSKSMDHHFFKSLKGDAEFPKLTEESEAKRFFIPKKKEEDLQSSLDEKEETIRKLKKQLKALKEGTSRSNTEKDDSNSSISLENENKVLREENQFLKQDLQRLSVHSMENLELVTKINELEKSLKDVHVHQPKEYVTITGMHEICENFLWLGDRFAAADTQVLKKLGITYLLTLYGTHEHEYSEPVKALCIPLCDFGNSDLGLVLKRCFAFIDEAKAKKQKILVHCAAGINRSPTIVIAYLMRVNQWKYRQAFDYVQDRRWFINPAPLYRKQLRMYEEVLFGRSQQIENIKSNTKQQSSFSLSGILTFWFGSTGASRPLLF